jgi:hypothetical protein
VSPRRRGIPKGAIIGGKDSVVMGSDFVESHLPISEDPRAFASETHFVALCHPPLLGDMQPRENRGPFTLTS